MLRADRVIARILTALVVLVTLWALPVGAATTFTDPQNTFIFAVPDGWQPDMSAANPGIVVQYLTTNPDGAFNVTTAPLPDGITIDAVPALVISRLSQQYADFQQTNLGTATVAGEPGSELDYTATNSNGTLIATAQIMVQHNGTLYFLTLAARPEDISAIQNAGAPILLSWQWLS